MIFCPIRDHWLGDTGDHVRSGEGSPVAANGMSRRHSFVNTLNIEAEGG